MSKKIKYFGLSLFSAAKVIKSGNLKFINDGKINSGHSK